MSSVCYRKHYSYQQKRSTSTTAALVGAAPYCNTTGWAVDAACPTLDCACGPCTAVVLGSVFNGRVGSAIIVLTIRVLREVEDAPSARVDRCRRGAVGAVVAAAEGGPAAQG